MRFGIISDLHLFNKTRKVKSAFEQLSALGIDALLLVGDLADRGRADQYALLGELIRHSFPDTPIFCVAGNHDIPFRDDETFRAFERSINASSVLHLHESGAFYAELGDDLDIVGLNPIYHQKTFWFPNRGAQIAFAESSLARSARNCHIVLCHPPLLEHNSLRGEKGTPYIEKEQDSKLQQIVDASRNVIFISGHTHTPPHAYRDDIGTMYVNAGSLCPTATHNNPAPGNIAVLDAGSHGVSIQFYEIQ